MDEKILELTKKLIAIPSTSDNPKALREVLDTCKSELKGFNYKEYEKNGNPSLLFYNSEELPKKFKIILNAHLDVVPAKKEQFNPTEKDGKLFGRGAYDMKTAGATLVFLFKEMAKKVNYPLGLQLVTDEEIGGFNGTKHQVEEGINADFVIAGENTDLKINHASKGIVWLKIKTTGKTAHGAYPWLGENAVWKMHKALSKLEKLYPVPLEEEWITTANVANIETNNKAYNKIPDECVAYVDIRYIPEDKNNVVDAVKKALLDMASVEVVVLEPDRFTDEKNQYIQKLIQLIQKETGKKGELAFKHGASDVRHYELVGGEGITFGPVGDGHHSDNEWLDIKSVETYYNILKDFLQNV